MKRKLFILGFISFLTYSCSTDESEIQQKKNSVEKINNQFQTKKLEKEIIIDSITNPNLDLYFSDGEPSNPIPPRS